MALITGTPAGSVTSQEDTYIDGAPNIYFQDYNADPLFNPDSNGFYYGMSGTSTYPAYEVGCAGDVALADNVTMNDVLCDAVGVKDTIQQRNFLEFTFNLKSMLPLSVLTHMLKGGAVTTDAGADTEVFGFGPINNSQKWMVYAPRVYDTDNGYYVLIHLHKAKFVDAWSIAMPFGTEWNTAIKLRAFVDSTKPSPQAFGVFLRSDASVL